MRLNLRLSSFLALFCLVYIACVLVDSYLLPEFDLDILKENNIKDVPVREAEAEKQRTVPKIFDFGQYVSKFRKNYNPFETVVKAKLFLARSLKIFQHNLRFVHKKVGYYLNQNEFTDADPKELKSQFLDQELEIEPIKEAHMNPNLPANKSPSVRKLLGQTDEHEDGFSEAAMFDSDTETIDSSSDSKRPVFDFMGEAEDETGNLDEALDALKHLPESTVKLVDRIDPASQMRNRDEIEANRQRVHSVAKVPSNNPNYRPQAAQSFAASIRDTQDKIDNYASIMMINPEFSIAYSPPVLENAPKSVDQGRRPNKLIQNLLSSLDDFFSPIDYDSPDEDVEPEEEGKNLGWLARIFGGGKKRDDDMMDTVDEQQAEVPDIEVVKPRGPPVYDVDWRLSGCISPVRDQMACNSCYAFTVLSLLEYFYCRQTKKLTNFSAQYIVDCGSLTGLKGCKSSRLTNVGKFVKFYGLELEANYPYQALEGQCPYLGQERDLSRPLSSQMGYLKPSISHWQNFQDMAAWYKWIKKSPVIVGINMPLDFLAYGGGVHDGFDCDPSMTHAMLLVGSGQEDGQEFWLMKNSFSEVWGESGYFRLAKSAPLRCFNSVVVARAKFDDI